MRLISRFSSLIHLLATSALATVAIALLGQSAIGQSITEVLWYNANTGELSAWLVNEDGTVRGKQPLSWRCDIASGCAQDWKVVGTSSNGVLWYNANTGELSAWLVNEDGTVRGKQPLSWRCDTASGCAQDWKVVGTSSNRVLWYNANTGELSAWLVNEDGTVRGKQPLSWRCDIASGCAQDWKVVGTSSNRVLWYNANTGELSAWLVNEDGTVRGKQPLSWRCDIASGCAQDWKVVGTSSNRVLWYNANTGELSAWLVNEDGTVRGKQPLSWRCDTASGCARDWKVVGIR